MQEVLVIGGSRYFGKRLIERLRDAGDAVTVVNRGSSAPPPGVRHLVADRDDEAGLGAALGGRGFDVVIDQVLYTPVQAAAAERVFRGRTGRYVMTSTIEVYSPLTAEAPLTEAAADPAHTAVQLDLPWERPEFVEANYGEGKRQAEAVLAASTSLPYAAVRTAHVLGGGAEDFTGRLGHYVDRIRAGEPVAVHPDSRPSSFIHYEEIAEFLAWTAGQSFTGPVNACSDGELDVTALTELIAARTGGRPLYGPPGAEPSPFSFDHYYGMDNSRAKQLGHTFSHIDDWLPGVIADAAPARQN
ncbi:reductase [Kitasatospora sp. McL0602]|uniref:reductase n=1 Tax=Kitasatospora sp. McL0602 TaxID=3439530 RepID=UPI003F8A30E8